MEKEITFIRENKLNTPVAFFNELNMLDAYNVLISSTTPDTEIYFAIKSCYHPPLLKAIAKLNIGAEVLSELEFDLAIQAGFSKILLNGMGRTKKFLSKAIANKNTCIILDGLQDIKHISELALKTKSIIPVGVRINLKIKGYKNNSYFTQEHKLGNKYPSPFFEAFFNLLKTNKNIIWDVFHAHFTINELDALIYKDAMLEIKKILIQINQKYKLTPNRIDLGGGLEVFDPKKIGVFSTLISEISRNFKDSFSKIRMILEPGRYLSAYAGYTIGTVLDIKELDGKTWLITDIGTNTLIPNSNARYKLLYPQSEKAGIHVGVTDGITSPSNNIIFSTYISELPQIGDYICIGNTGAYTDVYSCFWGYSLPQVCFYGKDGIRLYRNDRDIRKVFNLLFSE